jgi:Flp pilus assembly protein TadG
MRVVAAAWGATRGNVGVAFALTVIPLCAILGLAIDYLCASNLRSTLQAAADAAVLAAGAQGSDDDATLEATVALFMDANLTASAKAALGSVRVTFTKPATIRVEAQAVSKNSFLKLVGIDVTPVAVTSEAVMGNPLEVALVLDNTGSMAGSKEAALRKAGRELVDTVMVDQADVKVAVVPFSQYVNVGVGNGTAPWLAVTALPALVTWAGCVRSRPQPLDVSDRSPEIPYPFLAQQSSLSRNYFCPNPLTPLTAEKSVVMAAIDSMVMSSLSTYIPAGLMWGWNVLTPAPPFSEARAKGVRKAMVLMTDGANTATLFPGGFHQPDPNPAQTVNTMLTLCSNIKQAGIHLYTVAFAISGADLPVIGQLRTCASDSGSAFTADDGTALIQVFRDITKQLKVLRLAR